MKKFHGNSVPRPRMKKMIPTKQPLKVGNKRRYLKRLRAAEPQTAGSLSQNLSDFHSQPFVTLMPFIFPALALYIALYIPQLWRRKCNILCHN